jgi:hypothetical protein
VSSPAQRSKARRQQRYRQRQATGEVAVTIVVPECQVAAALITSGRLTPGEALDRRAVARALGEVVVDWSGQWKK